MRTSRIFFPVRILAIVFLFFGCSKETGRFNPEKTDEYPKVNESGFADNDMVMYWNEKVSTVLSAPMNQPTCPEERAIFQLFPRLLQQTQLL